jgi:pilus assembly protein Flp/PilA
MIVVRRPPSTQYNIQTTEEVTNMLRSFFAKEEGQGLVEYALILVLIAIVVIGILTLLGSKVSQVFSQINSGLSK